MSNNFIVMGANGGTGEALSLRLTDRPTTPPVGPKKQGNQIYEPGVLICTLIALIKAKAMSGLCDNTAISSMLIFFSSPEVLLIKFSKT